MRKQKQVKKYKASKGTQPLVAFRVNAEVRDRFVKKCGGIKQAHAMLVSFMGSV